MEKEYGAVKYFITYMVSGVGGAVFSSLIEMKLNDAPVSIGASGAIFGIFGVLLVIIFKNRRLDGNGTGNQINYIVCPYGIWKHGRRRRLDGTFRGSPDWCAIGFYFIQT